MKDLAADSGPVLSCSAYSRCLVNISITVVFSFCLEDPGRDRSARFCGNGSLPVFWGHVLPDISYFVKKVSGAIQVWEVLGTIKISSLTGFLRSLNMLTCMVNL